MAGSAACLGAAPLVPPRVSVISVHLCIVCDILCALYSMVRYSREFDNEEKGV